MTSEELYLANEKLVFSTIKKYFYDSLMSEDIRQEGRIGLWKACLTYDDSKGYEFSTYACKCIRNSILMAFRSSKNDILLLSLEQIINGGDDDNKGLTFEDVLTGELDVDYVDYESFCKRLTPEEKAIVELRLLGMTMQEIGKRLGLTQSCVSRKLKKIREKYDY